MAKLVWQEARDQANQILQVPDWVLDSGLPNLDAIYSDLGIKSEIRELPDGMSGLIIKKSKSEDARVFLSSSDTRPRQRFTKAHELGHYVERVIVSKDPEFSFEDTRTQQYDLHEFFADEFAGSLLMPEKLILQDEASDMSVFAMSEKYGVSVPAVQKRLDRLVKHR
ncbi:ImmA/IrrE family metallo-endopeptidase [Leucobacter sp. M11]|uniref:ImmA/IrrE family metallo-endopeptidase n=1 Tax=Leucobacter sp. M11 TaxID=2993565 RepID=UPI002D7EF48F|nr:ImmA/IrrE family metallo-endopeptidase [Leucobacter sp. M11]MEB4613985.1 ImmA/IrrE family metallo-endopeptidase [Leucobacter sp. M11]